MSISCQPESIKMYDSWEQRDSGRFVNNGVYVLETSVDSGLGRSGFNFRTYYLTVESYICLMKFLEPISA